MFAYRVPAAPLELEIPKIKGSRFIASVAFAADEAEAMAHVAAVRKQQHAARHVCWAWRTGERGQVSRSSDDGEPSGSAGKPILAAIEGADLTCVAVAVTRYFGGTKLGVGGLVRAYGGAAAEALAALEVRAVVPKAAVVATADWQHLGLLEAFCGRESLQPVQRSFGEAATWRFEVPRDEAEQLAERLVGATHGRIEVQVES